MVSFYGGKFQSPWQSSHEDSFFGLRHLVRKDQTVALYFPKPLFAKSLEFQSKSFLPFMFYFVYFSTLPLEQSCSKRFKVWQRKVLLFLITFAIDHAKCGVHSAYTDKYTIVYYDKWVERCFAFRVQKFLKVCEKNNLVFFNCHSFWHISI